MIKLNRSLKPIELTESLQTTLTDNFKLTGEAVWNVSFIKNALLAYSNNKCCYCETNIKEESKYLEVEHFHHKDVYKDEVLEWSNLLPSCKRCNGTKGSHDTLIEPIIDPSNNDPKMHLGYRYYRLKGKDDLGKLTISVLDLNNQDRLVTKRYEIGNVVLCALEKINENLDDYIASSDRKTRRKNRIIQDTKELMKEGLPNSIYSATTATVILNEPDFNTIKEKLVELHLWDEEMIGMETELQKIAFEL